MAELTNLNPRGIRVSPDYEQTTYHFYFCIIDVMATDEIDPNKFSMSPIRAGATEVHFQYSGTLVEPTSPTGRISIMLPLIHDQNLAQPNFEGTNLSFTITDAAGNSARGNPNQGRPPVVPAVDLSEQLIATILIFNSETTDSAFVGLIVNTAYNLDGTSSEGGYGNLLTLFSEDQVLYGGLSEQDGLPPLAAFGVMPYDPNGYQKVYISASENVHSEEYAFECNSYHTF
ncbi:MAG: hypothetical protein ACK417_09610 [Bacteroidia bacterium]|jgi:hypothetical protein